MKCDVSLTFVSLLLEIIFAVSEWMELLLPLAVKKGVCIITNMGASKKLKDSSKLLNFLLALCLTACIFFTFTNFW